MQAKRRTKKRQPVRPWWDAHSSQRAFTLLEVLVVIAVITTLIAVLMPSLAQARDHAKTVRCQSNLRQIFLAFEAYTMDFDDRAPRAAAHELGGQTGQVDYENPNWAPAVMFGGGLAAEYRLLNRYIADAYELFQCPSDQGEPIFWLDDPNHAATLQAYELYGSSYFYASGFNRAAGVMMPMGIAKLVGLEFSYGPYANDPLLNGECVQITRLPSPSKKVVIGDLPIHRTMPTIAAHPRGRWHRRNRVHVWANTAFLDGHVDLTRVFPFDTEEQTQWEGVTTIPSLWNPYY